jgi:hypothetical protein
MAGRERDGKCKMVYREKSVYTCKNKIFFLKTKKKEKSFHFLKKNSLCLYTTCLKHIVFLTQEKEFIKVFVFFRKLKSCRSIRGHHQHFFVRKH